MNDCKKVLIIGSSGLDSNLLELLDQELPDADVHLVGEGASAFQAAAQFGQAVDGLTTLFETDRVHSSGFRQYLMSEAFDQFARS